MQSDSHSRIQAFLRRVQTISLSVVEDDPAAPCRKAGIVPFLRDDPQRYYVMKPVARHAHLPPPEFQLCKGTRMHRLPNGDWEDIGEDGVAQHAKESLAETAIREGVEELGLIPDGIETLFELGAYHFFSATAGVSRQLWLFAAKMRSEECFLPASDVALTTAARSWLTLKEFDITGREDYRNILHDLESGLKLYYSQ